MELKPGDRVETRQMPESDPSASPTPSAAAAAGAPPDPQLSNSTSPSLLQPKLGSGSTWTDAFMKPPGYKNLNTSNWRWPPKLAQPMPPPSEANANWCAIV